jgi:hypothetical protein
VFRQQVLVGGYHGLTRFERSTDELKRLVRSTHDLDNHVHFGSANEFFPIEHEACMAGDILRVDSRAPAYERNFKPNAASSLDQVGVLRDDVRRRAAHRAKPDDTYTHC